MWRPRESEELLPPLAVLGHFVAPERRCGAIGLQRGDCQMEHVDDSVYCFYHHKMFVGLIEPFEPESYPVLPLPEAGYVLRDLTQPADALAA